MNSQKMLREVEDMLMRGLDLCRADLRRTGHDDTLLSIDTVKTMLTERARNITQAYADRLADEEAA